MIKERKYPIIALLAYIAMIIVNAAANIIPIGGLNTGEVSDAYPNLFAPAGYTFLIWSVIYIMLLLFILFEFGLFGGIKDASHSDTFTNINKLFILSCVINICWMFSWQYRLIWLSMIFMICLLICIGTIYMRCACVVHNRKEALLIRTPFAIYFGWLTVATLANMVTLFVSFGWNGVDATAVLITALILFVGLAVGLILLFRLKDPAYGLTLAWAYTGILVKQLSAAGFDHAYPMLTVSASICIVLLLAGVLYIVIKKKSLN